MNNCYNIYRVRYLTLIFLVSFTLALFAADGYTQEIDFDNVNESVLDGEYLINSLNWMLVESYFDKGDFENTIKVLERIVSLDLADIEGYSTLGWLLLSEEREEEAVAIYSKMVQENKNSAHAHFEMGFYYYRKDDLKNAEPWLKQAFDLELEPPKALIYGTLLERLGKEEEHKAFLEEMRKRYPEDKI